MTKILRLVALVAVFFWIGLPARADALPEATQKALKDLKLEASVLDGLDEELKVPQAWLDGAAKEEKVVILGSWDASHFAPMTEAFRERYPFIKLDYSRTTSSARGMKVLVALQEGRVIADVLGSIGGDAFTFVQMKALAPLRDLPVFKNLLPDYIASDDTVVGYKVSYRCMAYNTTKVKKEDLPKTWDELLTNPRWRNGNLSLSNHPDSWLFPLRIKFGEDWGTNFTRRLFEEVKPQLRKEGMSATLALTVAGEADANVPASDYRAQQYKEKGAPIGYHCPTPVPVAFDPIVMLEQAKHKNGARIFINWLLSREGQILQYTKTFASPIHKALQIPTFLAFPEEVAGKPVVVRDDALLRDPAYEKMLGAWNAYWGG